MSTPSDNTDPADTSTADADSPPGGSRKPYSFIWGLLFIVLVFAVVAVFAL